MTVDTIQSTEVDSRTGQL